MWPQVTLITIPFRTLRTWIPNVFSVLTHVLCQTCLSCKPSVTHSTRVLSWLVTILSNIAAIISSLHLRWTPYIHTNLQDKTGHYHQHCKQYKCWYVSYARGLNNFLALTGEIWRGISPTSVQGWATKTENFMQFFNKCWNIYASHSNVPCTIFMHRHSDCKL